MLGSASAPDVPSNPDIVGHIKKGHLGQFARHQPRIVRVIPRIAAQNPVLTQDPEITAAGDLGPSGRGRTVLGRGLLLANVCKKDVDFAELTAG